MTAPIAAQAISARSLVEDLRTLVEQESPSHDHDALAASAETVARLGHRLLGVPPDVEVVDGVPHLLWNFGLAEHSVLLLGHHDTVWPVGSWDPVWRYDGTTARGPGAFDMKAGLVQIFHAVSLLDDRRGVRILVTGDEEVGAATSRALIARHSRDVGVVLVTEASAPGGALKTGRAGVAQYVVSIHGRAAHAGLEPEAGINATVELAHQVLAITEYAALTSDVTVTPSLVSAGDTANTVPALARLTLDVRSRTNEAFWEIDAALTALRPRLPGARIEVSRVFASPALESVSSCALFTLAQQMAVEHGLPTLSSAVVGGASDANIAAAQGAFVLDGLGAVGGGAHALDEHVDVNAMPGRTLLLAEIVRTVLAGRLSRYAT